MSERVKFKEQPWHKYYQSELKPKYSPIVRILASRLQEGSQKRNPNITRRFVWWDIENHSIVVAETAHIMAENFQGELGATPEETTAGALLHDLTKPQEIIFDDLKDLASQRAMIQNLVNAGFASYEDLDRFDKDPTQGLNIYETIIHEAEIKSLLREHQRVLAEYGDPGRILDLSSSSGTPVVDLPKSEEGHHLPTSAHRIIFIADQLVQGTQIVPLEQRHKKARQMYNPELVDRLYEYAYRCADEISRNLSLSSHSALPEYIQSELVSSSASTSHNA